MYQSYEDLDGWKLSVDLIVRIYRVLSGCKNFGYKDQICRAAVSVPSNIAEGMERDSPKETIYFLHIAKGSCAEVRTQLLIGSKVDYLDETEYIELKEGAQKISRMLHGFIKFRTTKP